MRSLYFLLFPLVAASPLFGQSRTFTEDQFHVVWGAEHFRDANDLSATAVVRADGERVHVTVLVKDDSLVFQPDDIHTDHVEIWLSTGGGTNITGTRRNRVVRWTDQQGQDERVFLLPEGMNGDSLRREFSNPLLQINDSTFYLEDALHDERWGDDVHFLGQNWKLDRLHQGRFQEMDWFDGIVHWGIFPEERTPVLYDREAYEVLERQTGLKLDVPPPTSTVEQYEDGYRMDISFEPASFGFVGSSGIEGFGVMIDIIDVDGQGRQETLLSTSANREWGNPATFTSFSA